MKIPAAPGGLSAAAQKLWRKILTEMGEWEDSHLLLIHVGLQQWDEMQAALKIIKKDGRMVTDRFGQKKAHPLVAVFRDNANGWRQTHKLLGLDFMEVDE